MPDFFKNPILNSPYTYPGRHWELEGGQPSGNVIEKRRSCSYLTPIPKSKNRKKDAEQADLFTDQPKVSVEGVEYDPTSIVNQVRGQVDTWRHLREQGLSILLGAAVVDVREIYRDQQVTAQ